MEFVHRSYEKGKTIAAVATPPGEGGIAIIRISGHEALVTADKIFSQDVFSFKTHTAHYGKILSEDKQVIDEVLLLVMLGARSFTGEDTVEIHCHGGSLITKKVLERVLEAGASAALPGEFSFKAFMNGKIDLTQAEAIQELIAAKNNKALHAAQDLLQGSLRNKIIHLQKSLVEVAAIFEAWVDYPEEGLEFASEDEIKALLSSTLHHLLTLCSSYGHGKIIKEGLSLCLIGAPNVGKSSLMNALSGKQRAIVTNIAGTTRDTLDEELSFGDLHFTLTDTAGIRDTDEVIEQEGIKRSFSSASKSDLILLLLDVQEGWTEEAQELLNKVQNQKTLIIWNKIDLPHHKPVECLHPHQVSISAKAEIGLEELKEAIKTLVYEKNIAANDQVILTHERHFNALKTAAEYIRASLNGLEMGVSPELLCIDIKAALREFGTIIGTNITEDILNSIFSKFCVGK